MQCLQMKKRLIIFFTLILLVAAVIAAELNLRFPKEIYIYDGERLSVREGLPYTVEVPANIGGVLDDDGTIERSRLSGEKSGYNASLKLFGIIPVKTVEVNVQDTRSLTLGGKTIGIKLFTKGLVAVGISEMKGTDGKIYNIGNLYDIKTGDIILSANGAELKTTEEFSKIISDSSGEKISLELERSGKKLKKEVKAVNTEEGYKLGIWVRDSTAGIGTLTFLDSENGDFGALGHPITDADTGVLMPVSHGEITEASVVGVNKGEAGVPGELKGVFKNSSKKIGDIYKNTEQGIYGILLKEYTDGLGETLPVASRNSIREGKAHIISNVDGEVTEAFEIEIERVMRYNIDNYKDLVIEVTDERLLNKTGGIVQGMSGSPILQNGKIVGAVTHVFVNDPTRGYGIFIENMLAEAEKIK